jgi:diadenosine tetraphosphate (Ap4A) HIT family hydrolase
MGIAGCLACDLADGRTPLPGGVIHETGHWLVEHCVGPLGVGTLIVKPRRHVVHLWELDENESRELGPLLTDTAAVVAELAQPDQVYVCQWSHKDGVPVHIHFVVQPMTRETRDRHGGAAHAQAAMFDSGELPPAAEVESFASRAREAFGAR